MNTKEEQVGLINNDGKNLYFEIIELTDETTADDLTNYFKGDKSRKTLTVSKME